MARINPLDPANASAEVKATLDAVKAKLGSVPNLFLTFAVAPSVLNGYLALSGAGVDEKHHDVRQHFALTLTYSGHQTLGLLGA